MSGQNPIPKVPLSAPPNLPAFDPLDFKHLEIVELTKDKEINSPELVKRPTPKPRTKQLHLNLEQKDKETEEEKKSELPSSPHQGLEQALDQNGNVLKSLDSPPSSLPLQHSQTSSEYSPIPASPNQSTPELDEFSVLEKSSLKHRFGRIFRSLSLRRRDSYQLGGESAAPCKCFWKSLWNDRKKRAVLPELDQAQGQDVDGEAPTNVSVRYRGADCL
uniref:Uncharacterized protein n=1 Tax=Bursaphelenchus xylophilus TaxID=6326 RepID=A0A1I7RJH6_BURXY